MTVETRLTEGEALRLLLAERGRASLVDRIASEPWKVFPGLKPRPGEVTAGKHLYLMQAGESGPVKIGRANDPQQRARGLQPGCAEQIRLRAVLLGRGGDERALHARFGCYRKAGEWFEPHPAIFDWFGAQS